MPAAFRVWGLEKIRLVADILKFVYIFLLSQKIRRIESIHVESYLLSLPLKLIYDENI